MALIFLEKDKYLFGFKGRAIVRDNVIEISDQKIANKAFA